MPQLLFYNYQYFSSLFNSSTEMDRRSILYQKYAMYATTKGMMSDTMDMAVRVNSLDELLLKVRELDKSTEEG